MELVVCKSLKKFKNITHNRVQTESTFLPFFLVEAKVKQEHRQMKTVKLFAIKWNFLCVNLERSLIFTTGQRNLIWKSLKKFKNITRNRVQIESTFLPFSPVKAKDK